MNAEDRWLSGAKHTAHSLFTLCSNSRHLSDLLTESCALWVHYDSLRAKFLEYHALEYIWTTLYKSSSQPNRWMRITSGCSVNLPHMLHSGLHIRTLGLLCKISAPLFAMLQGSCSLTVKFLFSQFPAYKNRAALDTGMQKSKLKLRATSPTAIWSCHPKNTQHSSARSCTVNQKAGATPFLQLQYYVASVYERLGKHKMGVDFCFPSK